MLNFSFRVRHGPHHRPSAHKATPDALFRYTTEDRGGERLLGPDEVCHERSNSVYNLIWQEDYPRLTKCTGNRARHGLFDE